MTAGGAPGPLAPLPIRLRPLPAETAASYMRRLARANHLRPSYLRTLLSDPPQYTGAIRAERLAALSGRTIQALQHALPDLAPWPRPWPRQPARRHRLAAGKAELFTAIRHDHKVHGLSIRALAGRYQTHRRTVRQAITTGTPPPRREPPPRYAPALGPLRAIIDTMITAEPALTPRQTWERLLDEHDTEISYTTVRKYITRHHGPRSGPD
jgi:lambda repressor-like predicted transcriptional regulator